MEEGRIIYQGKTSKGTDIVIRYPKSSDAQQMLEYINTISLERTFIHYQGEQETLESEEKFLDGQLKKIQENKAVQLLVFHNDKLIGISGIGLQDRSQKHMGIFGITVAKEYRSEGIGSFLMKLVLEEAIKNLESLKLITLLVFANNPVAIEMYKKFGFVEYGRLPNGTLYQDQYVDTISMYKTIN